MKHFFDWLKSADLQQKPWLMLGKGPSFDRLNNFDTQNFCLLSLNHVVTKFPVTVAHIVDVDVVTDVADTLLKNAQVVVMPWRPHVDNRVGEKSLEQWCIELPVLQQLKDQGRLLWYDLSTTRYRHGLHPVVQATYFSAEAALSSLALGGVRQVRSLGVDGGDGYGRAFSELADSTRLNNGHASFDLQFKGFAATIRTTGVDYSPLDMESPIRVFVGSEEPQMLAVKVLEYSIKRHTSVTTSVVPLHRAGVKFPVPVSPDNQPRTPFSFQRFAIPQLAGYRGRAIYVDSDMQVFKDMRALWSIPFEGADLLAAREPGDTGRNPQFSVMMLDCERLKWTPESIVQLLDSNTLTYEQLMYEMRAAKNVKALIPSHWNSLERFEEGQTCLLHYTDMSRQPWLSNRNQLANLWVRYLLDAIDEGFISRDEVQEHVQRGWIKPSLLDLIEAGTEQIGWRLPVVAWRDRQFIPPHKKAGLGERRHSD